MGANQNKRQKKTERKGKERKGREGKGREGKARTAVLHKNSSSAKVLRVSLLTCERTPEPPLAR